MQEQNRQLLRDVRDLQKTAAAASSVQSTLELDGVKRLLEEALDEVTSLNFFRQQQLEIIEALTEEKHSLECQLLTRLPLPPANTLVSLPPTTTPDATCVGVQELGALQQTLDIIRTEHANYHGIRTGGDHVLTALKQDYAILDTKLTQAIHGRAEQEKSIAMQTEACNHLREQVGVLSIHVREYETRVARLTGELIEAKDMTSHLQVQYYFGERDQRWGYFVVHSYFGY